MSDKKKKQARPQSRPRARLPRGFTDRMAGDIRATEEMLAKIRAVFERYGFDPVETPMFEYTDALGKFLPDQDRPNEGVFSLLDDDEQWMSLRYDLTAPLARHVAENINTVVTPYRTYRAGWVYRNEKPGPGRFRQFMQFDADTVGAPGVQADAEMAMMMADTMEALDIKRGDYVVRVNNRKVLDGVMEAIGLGGEENIARRLNVLRAIDKLDRLGVDGVRQLLGKGRKDESGDFTAGVGLSESAIGELIRIFDTNQIDELIEKLLEFYKKQELTAKIKGESFDFEKEVEKDIDEFWGDDEFDDYKQLPLNLQNFSEAEQSVILESPSLCTLVASRFNVNSKFNDGVRTLIEIACQARICGYTREQIKVDSSVVRGLEYYTGAVFECELTFPVVNEKGETVVFGSVAGGGRYDGLVKRFTGQDMPATGFSIGVSRLMTALKNLGKLGASDVVEPVLVTVMDRDTEALGRYQKLTQDLRSAGIRAEMYQGNPKKFGNQLQYADRRGCPIAVIQGSDERERGVVQLKDMIEGKREAEAIASNEEWRERRPGQFEIAEADLVTEVKKRLAEQADDRARGE